jgi:hypothetical protein
LWTEDGLSMNTMETAGNSGFNEYEMLDWNTKSSVKQSCCSYHCVMSWGYHIHSSIFHIQAKSCKTLWPTRDELLHMSLRMIKITNHVTSNI